MTNPAPDQDAGIEILVDLARAGEIDPWDVDIVALTDKYLMALDRMTHRSLPLSGKAIFYGCVLLNLKAQRVYRDQTPALEPDEDGFGDLAAMDEDWDGEGEGEGDDGEWAAVVASDRSVVLVPRGRPRTRPITLDDLIRALKRCEAEERRRVESGFTPTSEYFIETTHQEDMEADIAMLRDLLVRLEEQASGVLFETIVAYGMGRVTAFTALLHMAARSEVELVQEEFYRDLTVCWRTQT